MKLQQTVVTDKIFRVITIFRCHLLNFVSSSSSIKSLNPSGLVVKKLCRKNFWKTRNFLKHNFKSIVSGKDCNAEVLRVATTFHFLRWFSSVFEHLISSAFPYQNILQRALCERKEENWERIEREFHIAFHGFSSRFSSHLLSWRKIFSNQATRRQCITFCEWMQKAFSLHLLLDRVGWKIQKLSR